MQCDLNDLQAVLAVARAGGFREAARAINSNPSSLSDAVRRAEKQLGVRLFHRTTRTVSLTEAGQALLHRLQPALQEVSNALDAVNQFRQTPKGTLRLNVPVSAARLILADVVPGFLARYPEIQLEVIADSNLVDIFASGCDAGIRYEESLEQDMVAIPIGPRRQRFALAAAPDYLARMGCPTHPKELLHHRCLRGRYSSGIMHDWTFSCAGETVTIRPDGPLIVSIGAGVDLAVAAAVQGTGMIMLFEDWLRPWLDRGELAPVLEAWWPDFSGPWLYYPDRRLVPTTLRAFIDYIRETPFQDKQ